MKIEHGTYTEAFAINSGDTYSRASKLYTNDIPDGTEVTLTLSDNSSVVIIAYEGTVIPLVTIGASWTAVGSETLIGLR